MPSGFLHGSPTFSLLGENTAKWEGVCVCVPVCAGSGVGNKRGGSTAPFLVPGRCWGSPCSARRCVKDTLDAIPQQPKGHPGGSTENGVGAGCLHREAQASRAVWDHALLPPLEGTALSTLDPNHVVGPAIGHANLSNSEVDMSCCCSYQAAVTQSRRPAGHQHSLRSRDTGRGFLTPRSSSSQGHERKPRPFSSADSSC